MPIPTTPVDPRTVAYDLAEPLRLRLLQIRRKAHHDPASIRLRLPTILAHLPCPRSARTPLPTVKIDNVAYLVTSARAGQNTYRLLWPTPLRGCWPLRLIIFVQLVLDIALHLKADTRRHIPLPANPTFITRFFRKRSGRVEIKRVTQMLDAMATYPLIFITPDGRQIKLRLLLKTPDNRYVINAALLQPITATAAFPNGLFAGPHVRLSLKDLQRADRLALDHILHLKARLSAIRKAPGVYAALRQLARQLVRWRSIRAALAYIHQLYTELKSRLHAQPLTGRLFIPAPARAPAQPG